MSVSIEREDLFCERLVGLCELLAAFSSEQLPTFRHLIIAGLSLPDVCAVLERSSDDLKERLRLARQSMQAMPLASTAESPLVALTADPRDADSPVIPPASAMHDASSVGTVDELPPPHRGDEPVGLEDDSLMSRLQQGDRDAFKELVERHEPWLRRYVESCSLGRPSRSARNCNGAGDGWDEDESVSPRVTAAVDDIVQDVLLKIYNQASQYVPQGRFRGWVQRIAHNLLIDRTRRESYDALVGGREEGDEKLLAEVEQDSPTPDEVAATTADTDLILQILEDRETFPEEQFLTFKLHVFAGLSLPEVAEVMETSTATTKSRLRLVREKLVEILKKRGVYFAGEEID